jgi:hypothetical protein
MVPIVFLACDELILCLWSPLRCDASHSNFNLKAVRLSEELTASEVVCSLAKPVGKDPDCERVA